MSIFFCEVITFGLVYLRFLVCMVIFYEIYKAFTCKALNVRLTSSVLSGNCVLQKCGLLAHRAHIQQPDVSENAKICPRHRYLLGKDYKPGRGCKHEDHVSQQRSRIPIVIDDC